MSKFSERLLEATMRGLRRFYGEDANICSDGKSLFQFKHYIDEENIIIITSNVRIWKGQFVLILGNNKVLYLKDWQVGELKNWELQTNTYAVKLNKNYFRPYTTKFEIDDVFFEKDDTFEDLVEVAKEQDQSKIVWKTGHYSCI